MDTIYRRALAVRQVQRDFDAQLAFFDRRFRKDFADIRERLDRIEASIAEIEAVFEQRRNLDHLRGS